MAPFSPDVQSAAQALLTAVSSHAAQAPDAPWEFLKPFVPKFIYFDDLTDLITDEVNYVEIKSDPPRYRAMRNMAELVGINLSEIASLPRHERQRLSRTAENILSTEASRFWEGQIGFQLTLEEQAMVVTIEHRGRWQKPSRRSRGLQWFLGLFVNFKAETASELAGAVLLIDEPGLHLHLTQQPKLIEFFNEISAGNQIIYTTHLPQMIPRGHIDRLRLFVKDGSRDDAVKVESKPHALPTEEDVLAPVRASIGIGLFETLSIGSDTVIVEGITDYYYLYAMSELCRQRRLAALPQAVSILPAGSAGRKMLPLLSAAWGTGVRCAVLVDDDAAGAAAEREIAGSFEGLLPVVRIEDGEERSNKEIEDLFDRGYFVALVCGTCLGLPTFEAFTARDLDDAKPIIDALTEYFESKGYGDVPKLKIALQLLERVEAREEQDAAALAAFAELFERLNTALESVRPTPPRRRAPAGARPGAEAQRKGSLWANCCVGQSRESPSSSLWNSRSRRR